MPVFSVESRHVQRFGRCLLAWEVAVIVVSAAAVHALHFWAFFRMSRGSYGPRAQTGLLRLLAAFPGVGAIAW